MSASSSQIDESLREAMGQAIARIPSGLFVLTASHEDRRAAMLASFVQQVCFEPPMISIAIGKGRMVMPLISESRQFALCQIAKDDRLLMRKFLKPSELGEDPFLGTELIDGVLPGVPILANAMSYIECELACHMDVEGDHDLFIGHVRGAGVLNADGEPHVHIRKNGFSY